MACHDSRDVRLLGQTRPHASVDTYIDARASVASSFSTTTTTNRLLAHSQRTAARRSPTDHSPTPTHNKHYSNMSGRGKGGKVRVFTWAVGNNSVLTVAGVDNRVSARAALSVTARFFATTSRVSPSLYVTVDPFVEHALITLQPGYSSSRSPWRCQAYLWPDLRGDSWCSEDFQIGRAHV